MSGRVLLHGLRDPVAARLPGAARLRWAAVVPIVTLGSGCPADAPYFLRASANGQTTVTQGQVQPLLRRVCVGAPIEHIRFFDERHYLVELRSEAHGAGRSWVSVFDVSPGLLIAESREANYDSIELTETGDGRLEIATVHDGSGWATTDPGKTCADVIRLEFTNITGAASVTFAWELSVTVAEGDHVDVSLEEA